MWTPLKTDRLILRPLEEGDRERLVALIGDWEVARMLSSVPHPYTEADFRDFLNRQKDKQAAGNQELFALTQVDRPTDGLIGCVGVHLDKDADNAGTRELGYWLGRPYWGKGYASEAARAAVDFAFERLNAPLLESGHIVGNKGSRNVLEKLGFRFTHVEKLWCVARARYVDSRRVVLTRRDWSEKRTA